MVADIAGVDRKALKQLLAGLGQLLHRIWFVVHILKVLKQTVP
jgi:hypothetical protein